jgi:2-amino-4-hydroxy-6-hydroxymethyldihydropteridine diphosphokinase
LGGRFRRKLLPVVLGLGSNRGDSRRVILDALTALGEILGEIRCAPLYETAPLYVTDQGSFINTAAAGLFPESPRTLLSLVQGIETRFGRDRSRERRWGERTLDIDILLFGNLIVDEPPSLVIPHPRLKERRFALGPLLDLLPQAKEPLSGLSYRAVFESLPPQGIRRLD